MSKGFRHQQILPVQASSTALHQCFAFDLAEAKTRNAPCAFCGLPFDYWQYYATCASRQLLNTEPAKHDNFIRLYDKKKGLYWRPDGCGYTNQLSQAGLFTQDEAQKILNAGRGPHPDPLLEIRPVKEAS